MAIIQAVVTDDGKEYLLKLWGGIESFNFVIDEFKIGEGGWIASPSGIVPRSPSSSLTDLDAISNPSRYAANRVGTFSKALVLADMTFTAPASLEIHCLVDFMEFNDNGFCLAPEVWEIGLFSDVMSGGLAGRMMVAYGTIPKQDKNPAVQLDNTLIISLS